MIENSILTEKLSASYLKKEELHKLIQAYLKCKNEENKNKLREDIFHNCIRFIRKKTIKRLAKSDSHIEDAFQEACIGFLYGLDKFNKNKKTSFLHYINFWISNSLHKEYQKRNIISIEKNFYNNERFKEMKNNHLVYFDEISNRSEFGDFLKEKNLIDSKSLEFENIINSNNNIEKYLKISEKYFSPAEKAVFKLKYAYEEADINDNEIAKALKVSHQAVNQFHLRAIKKLQAYSKTGNITKTRVRKDSIKNEIDAEKVIIEIRKERKKNMVSMGIKFNKDEEIS